MNGCIVSLPRDNEVYLARICEKVRKEMKEGNKYKRQLEHAMWYSVGWGTLDG